MKVLPRGKEIAAIPPVAFPYDSPELHKTSSYIFFKDTVEKLIQYWLMAASVHLKHTDWAACDLTLQSKPQYF